MPERGRGGRRQAARPQGASAPRQNPSSASATPPPASQAASGSAATDPTSTATSGVTSAVGASDAIAGARHKQQVPHCMIQALIPCDVNAMLNLAVPRGPRQKVFVCVGVCGLNEHSRKPSFSSSQPCIRPHTLMLTRGNDRWLHAA